MKVDDPQHRKDGHHRDARPEPNPFHRIDASQDDWVTSDGTTSFEEAFPSSGWEPGWQPHGDDGSTLLQDGAMFASETARPADLGTASFLELERELGELARSVSTSGFDDCSFELELPGHGPLEGRMTLRNGRAELELHAGRASLATTLRSRQRELQESVDATSGGEINLIIL